MTRPIDQSHPAIESGYGRGDSLWRLGPWPRLIRAGGELRSGVRTSTMRKPNKIVAITAMPICLFVAARTAWPSRLCIVALFDLLTQSTKGSVHQADGRVEWFHCRKASWLQPSCHSLAGLGDCVARCFQQGIIALHSVQRVLFTRRLVLQCAVFREQVLHYRFIRDG